VVTAGRWNAVWNGWTALVSFLTGWTGQIRERDVCPTTLPVPVACDCELPGSRPATAERRLDWIQVKNRRARLVWKFCEGRTGRLCTGG